MKKPHSLHGHFLTITLIVCNLSFGQEHGKTVSTRTDLPPSEVARIVTTSTLQQSPHSLSSFSAMTTSCPPVVFNGSLEPGDAIIPPGSLVWFPDSRVSTCTAPKSSVTFISTSSQSFFYDTYTLTNTTGSITCVKVTYTVNQSGFLYSVAYLNSFDPSNLATNYLADGGFFSNGTPVRYSFNLAAGATVVIVATSLEGGLPPSYTITVEGATSCNSITTSTLSSDLCEGSSVRVGYTANGTFNAGNTFTAQLSNATGDFTNANNIGSVSATQSGTINTIIPNGTVTGAGYRIRVVSSDPATTGSDNGADITIHKNDLVTSIPDAFALGSGVSANSVYIGYSPASSLTLNAQVSGGSAPYSYVWSTSAMSQSISVSPKANTTYSLKVTDVYGCSNTTHKDIAVVDVRCGNKQDKVNVCHKGGNTLCIGSSDVKDHLGHGDKLGACGVGSSITVNDNIEGKATARLSVIALSNPTHNYFTLQINGDNTEKQVRLRVMDAVGRVIETRSVGTQQSIQIGTLYRPGLYYAQVVQGKQRVTVKLLKQTK